MSLNPLSPSITTVYNQQEHEDICHNLKKLSYFSEVSDKAIAQIAQTVIREEFPQQTEVYKEGDDGSSMYFIIDGKIAALERGTLLAHLGTGKCFGESLFGGGKRIATIVTTEKTILYRFDKKTCENILMKQNSFCMRLLKELATKIRNSNEEKQLESVIAPPMNLGNVSDFSQLESVNLKNFSKPNKDIEISQSLKREIGAIPPDEIVKISTVGEVDANQLLFEQGDPCDYAYVILEGTVSICTITEETLQEIVQLGKGEAFGFMSMFDDYRSASAVIGSNGAILLKIDKDKFLKLLKSDKKYFQALLDFFLKRLQEANKMPEFTTMNMGMKSENSPPKSPKSPKSPGSPRLSKFMPFSKKTNPQKGLYFNLSKSLGPNIENPIKDIKIEDVFRTLIVDSVIPEKIMINKEQFWPNDDIKYKGEDFRSKFLVDLIKKICGAGLDVDITEDKIRSTVDSLLMAIQENKISDSNFKEMAQSYFLYPLRLCSIGCFWHVMAIMRDQFPMFSSMNENTDRLRYMTKPMSGNFSCYFAVYDKKKYTVKAKVYYETICDEIGKERRTVCQYPTSWTVQCDKSQEFTGTLETFNPIKICSATSKEQKYLQDCVNPKTN
ncbi:MAG: hypothetical protein K1000chlam3_01052 [Chlamydiae bacterium]|nr:hypothetical protein [Chlamydiota bacterium]